MGEPLLNGELTRAAVARYVEALNAHDADAIAACVSEDFVNEHTSVLGRNVTGRHRYRANLTGFLADFVDLRYEVEDLLVEGDRASLAYRMSFRLASAGGRPVGVRGVFRFRVDADGMIAHRIDYWDSGEVRRQLDT
ncbi:nuclear transport factor 2 family protein [Streptosporangium sp. NBC_01755]|uniref:nuclear transport factor 2 family protein n=1 Tax=unclassified Streptosporangium TaxID=2632669 RepID=UPI002DD89655|nr:MULTISPECIES: nuclear transport factor 2 family protein [unclassified Streptosporangium]WSA28271.1 nuclear transport factor 2 family protein [Streptosporangium sp. NBC_01810]WSD00252.1 nuclear transport factor 2 family protein [Streptosporangium sp. NBC_01755]